jgi:hypothetical protein
MAATRAGAWDSVASLMHPDALRSLRGLLTPVLQHPGGDEIRRQLFDVRSIAEADGLSDAAIFSRLTRASMGEPTLAEAMRNASIDILGIVAEGADTAHVVFRLAMTVDDIPVSRMDVMTLGRYQDTWRGLLKGDVSALAAALRRSLGG